MRKIRISTVLALLAVLLLVLPVSAAAQTFPDVIELPTGFQPEGIAAGRGSTFFTGSLVDGTVLRGDLRTGQSEVLVEGREGLVAAGMAYDERSDHLFVAGASTGMARIYDAASGELVQSYQLADPGTFINDVIVTRDAAYFTNSNQPLLYRLPLGPAGQHPEPEDVQTLTLTGDWQQVQGFNANGIEATPNGRWLVVVNSTVGSLYRVDPTTGEAVEIDLGSQGAVTNGDGLLFRGKTLYVVRNMLNQIAAVRLAKDLTSGEVVRTITNDNFNVPTTVAAFGKALYAVNAKFGVEDPANTPYEIVRVPLSGKK